MTNLPVRDRADAKLAGVCSALARRWTVDPVIVRVAFVIVGLLTNGLAIAVYFALWAILPERGHISPLHRMFPATRSWSWAAMTSVVALVTLTVGTLLSGSGPGAYVILALAWLILRFGTAGRHRGPTAHQAPLPPSVPATPFERAAQAWQQRIDNVEAGRPADWVPEDEAADRPDLYGPTSPWDAPTRVVAPPTARRRGVRTWFGILVVLGLTWSGLALAGVPLSPLGWLSTTLLVLGGALVVCAHPTRTVWGRPALLLPTTILVALSVVPMLVPNLVGARAHTLAGGDAPVITHGVSQLSVGDHTIDLSSREISDETLRYDLPLGAVTVTVPSTGNVVVRASTALGEVSLPGGVHGEGFDIQQEWSRIVDPAAVTLTIDVTVGLGEVTVRS